MDMIAYTPVLAHGVPDGVVFVFLLPALGIGAVLLFASLEGVILRAR